MVLVALWLFVNFSSQGARPTELSFTRLESLAAEGGVDTATFLEREQLVEGRLAGGDLYRSEYPLEYQDELVDHLKAAEIGRAHV